MLRGNRHQYSREAATGSGLNVQQRSSEHSSDNICIFNGSVFIVWLQPSARIKSGPASIWCTHTLRCPKEEANSSCWTSYSQRELHFRCAGGNRSGVPCNILKYKGINCESNRESFKIRGGLGRFEFEGARASGKTIHHSAVTSLRG